jgi:hypothetical protein
MSKRDSGFDYDRYRKLLAEAVDEPKRLALIDLLLSEKARDQLAAANTRGLIGSIIMGNRSHPPEDAEPAGED